MAQHGRVKSRWGWDLASIILAFLVAVSAIWWAWGLMEKQDQARDTAALAAQQSAIAADAAQEAQRLLKMDSLDHARTTEPLSQLQPRDRVLYDVPPERPLCKFVTWQGSIENAVIKCPGEDKAEVLTGFLTPVEPIR